MLNRVILIGHLANDPELKYTPSGIAVSTFRVAVSRPFTNAQGEREADFIDIVAWRQTAEFAGSHERVVLASQSESSGWSSPGPLLNKRPNSAAG